MHDFPCGYVYGPHAEKDCPMRRKPKSDPVDLAGIRERDAQQWELLGTTLFDEVRQDRRALLKVVEQLGEALRGLMAKIDDHTLVRNIAGDLEPGWSMRQLPLIQALAAAKAALALLGETP